MKFGPVPLDQAKGGILAHSCPLSNGRRLRKGKELTDDDIETLRAEGLTQVTVAIFEARDVPEDEAADRLAKALVPDPEAAQIALGVAATGRVNVTSRIAGIAQVDATKIHALNRIHPMITVATVPEWQRLEPKDMVATVKIIAYAVPETALDAACAAARDAITMRAPQYKTADLIQSTIGDENGEKGHKAIAERLARLGVSLGDKCLVGHHEDQIANALLASDAEVLFILTGSATSDIRDTAPEAVVRAGGVVHHFGMPVDPGNLLFFGELNGKPVIGLPGCARSPALNGADWVLERILCGVTVTPDDIAAMGVGGLLKDIPLRGRLRNANSD